LRRNHGIRTEAVTTALISSRWEYRRVVRLPAAAISAAISRSGVDWGGAAQGRCCDDRPESETVDHALALHSGHLEDPLEILRRLWAGAKFAAIAGTIIAARTRLPVILEGFAGTAAAAGTSNRAKSGGSRPLACCLCRPKEPGHP